MNSKSIISRIYMSKIIVVVLLFMMLPILNSCRVESTLTHDYNSYLNDDSEFTKGISLVMPSREELSDQKILSYSYYDDGMSEKVFIFAHNDRMILMTVEYTEEDFMGAVQLLEDRIESVGLYDEEFYLNGNLYKAAMTCAEDRTYYCAIAYCVNEESRTISYIAFTDMDLEYMNVESALGLFYEYDEVTNSIVIE